MRFRGETTPSANGSTSTALRSRSSSSRPQIRRTSAQAKSRSRLSSPHIPGMGRRTSDNSPAPFPRRLQVSDRGGHSFSIPSPSIRRTSRAATRNRFATISLDFWTDCPWSWASTRARKISFLRGSDNVSSDMVFLLRRCEWTPSTFLFPLGLPPEDDPTTELPPSGAGAHPPVELLQEPGPGLQGGLEPHELGRVGLGD